MKKRESLCISHQIIEDWRNHKIDTNQALLELKAEFFLEDIDVSDVKGVLLDTMDIINEKMSGKVTVSEAVGQIKQSILVS